MSDLKHCHRCGRRYRGHGAWNVAVRRGVPRWVLCPDCQTDAEDLEAQVNAATLDYATDAFGRLIGTPKGGVDADHN